MKITMLTVSTTVITNLIDIGKDINDQYSNILDLKLYYTGSELPANQISNMKQDMLSADVIFVDLMGSPRSISQAINSTLPLCKKNIIPIGGAGRDYLRLGALTSNSMGKGKNQKMPNPEAMKKMMNMAEKMGKIMPMGKPKDMRNLVQIGKYFKNATYFQLQAMLYLLLRDYGKYKNIPKPNEAEDLPDIGIKDPHTRKYYNSYQEYCEVLGYNKQFPTIAILYYGHTYPNDTSPCIAKIIKRINEFANVIPIAFNSSSAKNIALLKQYLTESVNKKIAVILNFMSFRLGAGPMGGDANSAVSLLQQVAVPVLHPFFMSRRKIKEWQESTQGINSSEFLLSVMLPELDGCIETYPVGAMSITKESQSYQLEIKQLTLIEERVNKLISRIKAIINLQQIANSEKKVAIVGYNYPPGEANLFGGAFLDTFVSIQNILQSLIANGYRANPLTAEQLKTEFTDKNIVNSSKWSESESNVNLIRYNHENYQNDLNNKEHKTAMIQQWGDSPGTIMADNKEFLIPGIINKNIFIGLQPSRGIHENPEKVYHDKTLLPHHQYAAFYKYLKEEFKADVIIHVGTHGTIEFLKGKECGMSGDCFPDLFINDLPHLYLYYCGNPAEAMIAKRRSYATLVSYLPPVFTECELYGDFAKLATLIDEYQQALRLSPVRSEDIYNKIVEQAKLNNLPINIDELEAELYRMKRSLIPKGLHAFGEQYSEEELQSYIQFVLRYDRGEIKSLRRIAAESLAYNYQNLLNENNINLLKQLDDIARLIIKNFFSNENNSKLPLNISQKDLNQSLAYANELLSKCQPNNELKGLLKALNAEYLPVRLAGDTIRSPEVLPSGYNLYQFDPRLVPSVVAYERGSKIAENTIKQYLSQHGQYPKSTAVILWGLETSRTQGETVGQILAYLGIRVKQTSNIWQPQFEIIPLTELGRPRIDVVVNICGFFRDMFGNIIDSLNRVLSKLAELNEDNEYNYYKANVNKIYTALITEGYNHDEATELARSRIFGPAEAEYGTGITKIIETKNWQEESEIADSFIKSLNHIYSPNYRGRKVEQLYNKNLAVVDIVSQIRSNHEYEVTDLDHYYEFFGGLAKSVEIAKGEKSEIYISDTTGERIETESVEKSINRGVRTRLLNPKWINAMLAHDYHGAQNIAERFENIMGLSATTNRVEQWIYNDMYELYIENEDLKKRMLKNNKWAYHEMIEYMFEYDQRDYWNATKEQLQKLQQVYLEIEGEIE